MLIAEASKQISAWSVPSGPCTSPGKFPLVKDSCVGTQDELQEGQPIQRLERENPSCWGTTWCEGHSLIPKLTGYEVFGAGNCVQRCKHWQTQRCVYYNTHNNSEGLLEYYFAPSFEVSLLFQLQKRTLKERKKRFSSRAPPTLLLVSHVIAHLQTLFFLWR